MTVEASLLMPMVIFILAGLCYSFFFMHDYIVMQNEGYRRTEAELWHRETEEDMPVFMMSVLLDGFGKSILQQAADWVNHQSRAHVVLQGELKIPVPGMLKTCSMTRLPARISATTIATNVITGINALRRTWPYKT